MSPGRPSSDDSFSLTLACPCCHREMEIRLPLQQEHDGFHLPMGTHRCPSCGKELMLYVSRKDQQCVEFRLIDPSREWTFEEIMNREG